MVTRAHRAVTLTITVLLGIMFCISFATRPTNAQDSAATPSCSDPTYGDAYASTGDAIKKVNPAKPSTTGSALLAVIKARYQYVDTAPPAGCESMKPLLIQFLATEEDTLYATLGTKFVDYAIPVPPGSSAAQVKADFADITSKAMTRLKAISPILKAAFPIAAAGGAGAAIETRPATLDPRDLTATAKGAYTKSAQVCADAAFTAQVTTDWNTYRKTEDNKTPVIKLRYKYEDLTAPSGCEDGRTALIQAFTAAEDQAAMNLMTTADQANASTYRDFTHNIVFAEEASAWDLMTADFPVLFPTPTPTVLVTIQPQ